MQSNARTRPMLRLWRACRLYNRAWGRSETRPVTRWRVIEGRADGPVPLRALNLFSHRLQRGAATSLKADGHRNGDHRVSALAG